MVVLAIPEALSQLGIVDRFLTETADGGRRYVSWENHDTFAKGLLATLAVIETEQLANRVTVVRRDGTALCTNELTPGGGWRRRPAAERVVRAERARPWTAPETAVFRRDLARTDRACTPNWRVRTGAWRCNATASARPPGPSRSAARPAHPGTAGGRLSPAVSR
ncbi:zeta toxin family protein [Streptomyces sp. NPDC002078]